MPTYVIIGAGISGLSAAYWLRQRGASTFVLESSNHIGGTMTSEHRGGFLFEHGPNSFLNNNATTAALVEGCGAHNDIVSASTVAKQRLIHHGSQLFAVPSSPPTFFRSALLSRKGKLRMFAEPFLLQEPPDHEETLAEFLDRRIGNDAREILVDALVGGIYAGDTRQLSAKATFPALVDAEHRYGSMMFGMIARMLTASRVRPKNPGMCSFRHGMQRLPTQIVEFLGKNTVQTGAGSINVRQTYNKRYVTSATIDGSRREIESDGVIIATPAHRTASVIAPFFPKSAVDALLNIPYAPVQLVGVGFPTSAFGEKPPVGFGFLVSRRSELPILGCIYSSAVFPDRAPTNHTMLTVFLGGARNPETAAMTDDALLDRAVTAIRNTLHVAGPPTEVFLKRWDRGIPQFTLGHRTRINTIRAALSAQPGLMLVGNYLDGVSMHDCIESGKQAAQTLVPGAA